jgi:IS30 family transposase
MNYKQLTNEKKAQIDILLDQGLSMRKVAEVLGISHSTISRYRSGIYKKREIDITKKYDIFLHYLYSHYNPKTCSIEICVFKFKRNYLNARCPTVQQVYNWINEEKIKLTKDKLCYKKHKSNRSSMISHTKWNFDNKTVLPISLRPKYINKRDELGHLEIDSILGLKKEYSSIISIVDRCSRRVWLIKAEYKNEYYINKLIYDFLLKNEVLVRSITVDNGLEFDALGITAKKLGVKLYKCDPYCSFQRGTNERTNALVRRFIPKGSSMKYVSQVYLDEICFEINSMPSKLFDYKCSYDIELKYN